MANSLYEIVRDGQPSKQLFLSEESARLWINTHGTDGACYSVREYKPPQKAI